MNEEHKKIIEETPAQLIPTTATPVVASSLIKDLSIPLSIVVAGLFIGAGLYFSGQPAVAPAVAPAPGAAEPTATTDAINEVTEADHIKGDINAPIKIVEYSDFECPFCKQYHETLETVIAKYDGEVAWVFRQFPLEQLHAKALPVALASECVAELGGNSAFWTFTDGYFRDTLTNDRTNIETAIPKLVLEAGVPQDAFSECFESGRTASAVQEDVQNAIETGGRGTPWSILIGPSGKTYPINGALPAAAVEQAIQKALSEA